MSIIAKKLATIINNLFGKNQIDQLQKQVSSLQKDQASLTKESETRQAEIASLTQQRNKLQAENERLSKALAAERKILSAAKDVVHLAKRRDWPLERAFDIDMYANTLETKLESLEKQCHCGCPECNPAPVACTCGCPSCCQVVPGNTPKPPPIVPKIPARKNVSGGGGDDDDSGPRLHPLPSDGGIFSPK